MTMAQAGLSCALLRGTVSGLVGGAKNKKHNGSYHQSSASSVDSVWLWIRFLIMRITSPNPITLHSQIGLGLREMPQGGWDRT
jgi:hypothetical protein